MVELGRRIGAGYPPFIITTRDARELLTLPDALAAVDAAASTRCDAVKLGNAAQGALPWAWCGKLFQRAHERNVILLARPDDEGGVERFDWLGAHAFDLAFDLIDLDTIAAAALTGKPIVMSIGTASDLELGEAVEIVQRSGGTIALIVPTLEGDDMQRVIALQKLGVAVGVTDSHPDSTLALAAIACGASIIEKRSTGRDELSGVIRRCELAWSSLGNDSVWATN